MEQQMLVSLLDAAAELGAITVMVRSGLLKPYIKKSEAYRHYGRKNVDRWITQGSIAPRKDGGHSAAWRIDRLEIAALALATDLLLKL